MWASVRHRLVPAAVIPQAAINHLIWKVFKPDSPLRQEGRTLGMMGHPPLSILLSQSATDAACIMWPNDVRLTGSGRLIGAGLQDYTGV